MVRNPFHRGREFKTQMCGFLPNCRNGVRCTYAHIKEELLRRRPVDPEPPTAPAPAPREDEELVSFTSEYELVMDEPTLKRVARIKGAQAHVFHCRHQRTQQLFFLKVFHGDSCTEARVKRERALAREGRDSHVLTALQFFWEENTPTHLPQELLAKLGLPENFEKQYSAVYEMMDGDLCDLIYHARKDRRTLSVEDVHTIVAQVLRGLRFLHKRGVVHRDIKLENVYYKRENGRLRVCVGDFGVVKPVKISGWVQDYETPNAVPVGTAEYTDEPLPPGAGAAFSLNEPSYDVWCVGVMYGLYHLDYIEDGAQQALADVRGGNCNATISLVPGYIGDLLRWMLARDRKSRPTAEKALRALGAPLGMQTEP